MIKVNFKDPAIWLATWFGCGLMRPAPGTWGTIGALPFGILFLAWGGLPLLAVAVASVCMAGYWAAGRFEDQAGEHDSGAIVIDEVAGMWIALLPTALNIPLVVAAFLLFRLLDILKPWPISWADKKLPGAIGVMMDDIIAGTFVAVLIVGARLAGFG
ncbi:MAG: phosphatidylglycerophosphatase A [Micavibrio aeruginosavorus]|uniref:Phosphatidylglycerophosphatase A n=1 Tax=Micavibrio aeruginosavorus TaxID=349221 RepID=A0A7T5UFP5_9BACT|nr:MAG: phosphatidylglycerophosphatase A [Micavibrio aeruginosavorus]